jgi:hypothetical protein
MNVQLALRKSWGAKQNNHCLDNRSGSVGGSATLDLYYD